jgi:hypothetical protein
MGKEKSTSARAARRKVKFKISAEFKHEISPDDIAWTGDR